MDLALYNFSDLNLSDSFFDSLRASYEEFDSWFKRKQKEGAKAYAFLDADQKIKDFLYLKIEDEELNDVTPSLPAKKRLKVGTFKILPRHTHRGERFMKKIMDIAMSQNVDEIYVTIFPTPELVFLIKMFNTYGFVHVADKANKKGFKELVLVKSMREHSGNILNDYPFVKTSNVRKNLLSIYPTYHTKLFPDSILSNESYDLVQDISPTNSIYKTYICWMKGVSTLKKGDLLVIYRTNDNKGLAAYRSVATSICTVLETKQYIDFDNCDAFLNYTTNYSIFSKDELCNWYKYKPNFVLIKMLYNVAFTKKIIRKSLIENVHIPPETYWGFCDLTNKQFNDIIKLGEANERYFID